MKKYFPLLYCLLALPVGVQAQSTISLQTAQLQLPAGAIPVDVGIMNYRSQPRPELLVPSQGTDIIYAYGSPMPQVFGRLVQQYPATQPLSLLPIRLSGLATLPEDFVVLTADGNVTPWRRSGTSHTVEPAIALRQGLACSATDRLVVGKYSYLAPPGINLDLALWSSGPQPGFSRARNLGNGTFQVLARVNTNTVSTGVVMTTANLNSDITGLEDALLPRTGFTNTPYFLQFNNAHDYTVPSNTWPSRPSFSPPTLGNYCTTITAGDVNGDQVLDVVVAGASVAVHLGNFSVGYYDVSYNPDTLHLPSAALARDVRLADLNGDSRPEILVLSADGSVSVYENTSRAGTTLFNPTPLRYFTGFDPAILRVADADADGDLDVLIPCRGDHSITILWNGSQRLGTTSANDGLELAAYPNPAQTDLHIRWSGGPATATLLDLTGRVVRQWASLSQDAALDVADLRRGVYVLRVAEATGTATRRIVLE